MVKLILIVFLYNAAPPPPPGSTYIMPPVGVGVSATTTEFATLTECQQAATAIKMAAPADSSKKIVTVCANAY